MAFRAVLLFVLCFVANADKASHLTASPETILDGLTSDLTLRCSLGDATPSVNSVLLIQMERVSEGRQVPVATIHDGQVAVLESSDLTGRANVNGVVDSANVSQSFLQLVIRGPDQRDQGQYDCVIMVLDTTNLLTQLPSTVTVTVNRTEAMSMLQLHQAVEDLSLQLGQLKARVGDSSGSCACAGDQGNGQIQALQKVTQDQAEHITELRHKVTSLESVVNNGISLNGSFVAPSVPTVTPMKPLGFVAVGPAGSVQYTSTVYNTNGSYDLQHDQFTAPYAGFYFFHAYDSQPTSPLLSLVLNDHPLANSAKAVPLGQPVEGQSQRYSPLSVSGLVHLNAGDVIAAKYVANTQNMGVSFSGALVSANDA